MSTRCFPCISPRKSESRRRLLRLPSHQQPQSLTSFIGSLGEAETEGIPASPSAEQSKNTQHFTLQELTNATQNFKEANLLGEGGFGKVFKGRLDSGQVVAIKQLNHDGTQGCKEFLVECLMLIMLNHPHLVKLIGYCMQGQERLLVYEYMPQGSLETHLFDLPPNKVPLDWNTRIKIALGASKGLAYLHNARNPPVIYRDLKSANILLDNEFSPKLSDFGLAKLGPTGDNTHVSTRVMGTYGYCAPDYAMSGKLTVKCDVYSLGVVLLELMTGRRAFDSSRKMGEQNLIVWSQPYLKDRKRFNQLADPLLRGQYPPRSFYHVAVITSMCLQQLPHNRPSTRDIVRALEYVASHPYKSAHASSNLPKASSTSSLDSKETSGYTSPDN